MEFQMYSTGGRYNHSHMLFLAVVFLPPINQEFMLSKSSSHQVIQLWQDSRAQEVCTPQNHSLHGAHMEAHLSFILGWFSAVSCLFILTRQGKLEKYPPLVLTVFQMLTVSPSLFSTAFLYYSHCTWSSKFLHWGFVQCMRVKLSLHLPQL